MLTNRNCAGLVLATILVAFFIQHHHASAMSIETSDPQAPVKVTHKNSGPTYDIELQNNEASSGADDGVAKKRVSELAAMPLGADPPAAEQPELPGAAPSEGVEQPSIGHVTIRRIFLVPMMSAPQQQGSQEERQPGESSAGAGAEPPAPFGLRPFWPFMTPPAQMAPSESGERPIILHNRHHHRHHILGGDQASRSPSSERDGGERESSAPTAAEGPMFDPIRMMIDLMHQAINERMASPESAQGPGDLRKEASTTVTANGQDNKSDDSNKPVSVDRKAQSHNETKEEIVEIEGKKYLKKSVINRHVGENIIFMTRRLIFVPLNETDSGTTVAPTTQKTELAAPTNSDAAPKEPEATTTTTTTTTTVAPAKEQQDTTVAPKSSDVPMVPSSEQPVVSKMGETEETTTSANPTTQRTSLLDRMSDAIDRYAERIVEKAKEELSATTSPTTPSTTTAPSTNNQ